MAHFEKDEGEMLPETGAQQSDEVGDSNFRRLVSRKPSASISIPMASLESYEEKRPVKHTNPPCSVRKSPKVPMLSETRSQLSDEVVDSNFRRLVSRTRSASFSIPMASLESYEKETSLVGHTSPLRTASGPLYATNGTANLSRQRIVAQGNKVAEIKTEKFSTFDGPNENRRDNDYDRKHEHLMRSGQLGLCNDPYCTTCPTYFKASQPRTRKTSTIFHHKFHNYLYGDAKGFGRKLLSFCSSYIPGVMNPHAKVVQQWNKMLAIFCLVAIFVDPLFFFLIHVKEDEKCIAINWRMTLILAVFRSLIDLVYFFNLLLQFRMAYVAPDSAVLVDCPNKIALNYLKGYFLIDLFVVFPFPQIMILFVLPNHLGASEANYAISLLDTVMLVQYFVRLFRFLRIGWYPTGHVSLSSREKIITNLLIFIPSSHFVGSLWYLVGLQRVNQCLQNACHNSNITGCSTFIGCSHGRASERESDLWNNNVNGIACFNSSSSFQYGIYEDAVPLTTDTRIVNKYVFALFWGFQQIISLADNLTPNYNYMWEVIFTMAIMGLGLAFFALLIGNIQNLLQARGSRRLEMEIRDRDVEEWMIHRRIPEELRRRIKMAEWYNQLTAWRVHDKMLMENLPEDLQIDIRRHLFKFVKKIRIFSLLDQPVLDAIYERLKHKTYIRGCKLLIQGDRLEKMVFVVRGKLESFGEDGTVVPLSEGNACGEELLTWYLEHSSVSTDGKKVRLPERLVSTRTVRCLTNVEAISLHLADLEDLAILFPGFLLDPRIQQEIRYTSPYWRSLAAKRIQEAWRNRKKSLNGLNRADNS